MSELRFVLVRMKNGKVSLSKLQILSGYDHGLEIELWCALVPLMYDS